MSNHEEQENERMTDKKYHCGHCATQPRWNCTRFPKTYVQGDETLIELEPHVWEIHKKDGSILTYRPDKYSPSFRGENQ